MTLDRASLRSYILTEIRIKIKLKPPEASQCKQYIQRGVPGVSEDEQPLLRPHHCSRAPRAMLDIPRAREQWCYIGQDGTYPLTIWVWMALVVPVDMMNVGVGARHGPRGLSYIHINYTSTCQATVLRRCMQMR